MKISEISSLEEGVFDRFKTQATLGNKTNAPVIKTILGQWNRAAQALAAADRSPPTPAQLTAFLARATPRANVTATLADMKNVQKFITNAVNQDLASGTFGADDKPPSAANATAQTNKIGNQIRDDIVSGLTRQGFNPAEATTLASALPAGTTVINGIRSILSGKPMAPAAPAAPAANSATTAATISQTAANKRASASALARNSMTPKPEPVVAPVPPGFMQSKIQGRRPAAPVSENKMADALWNKMKREQGL
jgi:hypothetical protein